MRPLPLLLCLALALPAAADEADPDEAPVVQVVPVAVCPGHEAQLCDRAGCACEGGAAPRTRRALVPVPPGASPFVDPDPFAAGAADAPALELAEPIADCLARTTTPLTLDPAAQCALAAHLIADDLALTSAHARQASAETCGEACRSLLPAPIPWGPIVAVAGAVAVLAFAGGVIVGALGGR